MRILVGTPCGGGQVTVQYLLSLLDAHNQSAQHKQFIAQEIIRQSPGFDNKNPQHMQGLQVTLANHTYDIGIYTMSGESLLARGRNHMAATALRQGWNKLLFIDADEGFTFEDFKNICSSPHPITAGVVPLKTFIDQPRSFRTSLNYLPFADDEKYYDRAIRDLAGMERHVAGSGSHLLKVAFTGTGFMCIDSKVLMHMTETSPHYLYPDPSNGQVQSHWGFFDGGPINAAYYSEDWAMCQKARDLGYDIVVDTRVKITHTGNHTFRAG